MLHGCLSTCCHYLFGILYSQPTHFGSLMTSVGATHVRRLARRQRRRVWSMRASSIVARSPCGDGTISKQVRRTKLPHDSITNHDPQNGDSKHQAGGFRSSRRRPGVGRSNSKGMSNTTTIDSALWRRVGREAGVLSRWRAKRLHIVPRLSYCIAGILEEYSSGYIVLFGNHCAWRKGESFFAA
jgi:hypothetical protein